MAVLRYWLDLGVEGCGRRMSRTCGGAGGYQHENLPETHLVLKQIRANISGCQYLLQPRGLSKSNRLMRLESMPVVHQPLVKGPVDR